MSKDVHIIGTEDKNKWRGRKRRKKKPRCYKFLLFLILTFQTLKFPPRDAAKRRHILRNTPQNKNSCDITHTHMYVCIYIYIGCNSIIGVYIKRKKGKEKDTYKRREESSNRKIIGTI